MNPIGVDIAQKSISMAYRDPLSLTQAWKIYTLNPNDSCGSHGEKMLDAEFEHARMIGCDLVAIEEPYLDERKRMVGEGAKRREVWVTRPDTYGILCKVFGMVTHAAQRQGMKVIGVTPAEWRQVIHWDGYLPTGRDDLKAQSFRVATELLNAPVKTHDEADAVGMCEWATRTYGRGTP